MASPYRRAEEPPPPRPIAVFRGRDEARYGLAWWLVLLAPLAFMAPRVGFAPLPALLLLSLAAGLLHAVDSATRRFALRVGPRGYHLRRYRFGFLRTGTFRASLEWHPSFVDLWDDYSPPGLTLEPPQRPSSARGGRWPSAPSFGPTSQATAAQAMVEQIAAAMHWFRLQVAAADALHEQRRHSGDVGPLRDHIEPGSIRRGPWGRVRSLRLQRGTTLHGIRLPAGTTVDFAFAEEWQSPATPDRLTSITLGAPVSLAPLRPNVCGKGATLTFDGQRRLRSARSSFSAPTLVQGVLVDGGAPLSFDERGSLLDCALGAPLTWGPLRLPVGARAGRGTSGFTFHGPRLTLVAAPEAHVVHVQARLTRLGKRSSLAQLLLDPAGRVERELTHLERPPGTPRHIYRTLRL